MLRRRLRDVRSKTAAITKVVSFPILLTLATGTILSELLLIFLLPYLSDRYQKQTERAETLLRAPAVVLREYESLNMVPPIIGVLYRRQMTRNQSETESLFRRLLALDDVERLRLLQQKSVSDDVIIAVLGRCYAGGEQENRLEEFLIRAIPQLDKERYLAYPASMKLYRNYFYTAERSQYAGLIQDARRLYSRFVELGRMLNRDIALGVEMHRHLNRANVRLKTLAAEHAFETGAVRKIQDGPAEVTASFINYRDPRLAALARYNAASFLWHDDRSDEAVTLLKGPKTDCGVLRIECKFLLAKILDSEADMPHMILSRSTSKPDVRESKALAGEAKAILDALVLELPDDHPLLDDIYFHRALVARFRENADEASAELRQLEHRCPHTDLVQDVKILRDEPSGRFSRESFGE